MKFASLAIVKKLQNAGFAAYWAGGSVRDMLLAKQQKKKWQPKDFDIATSATPDQIETILPKTYPVGRQFGVLRVHQQGHEFEVATFRSDSGYSDGRHPDAVLFTNPQEDAKRRDFTINGLFYDPVKKHLYDYVGGQEDLLLGLIRFIGRADERIKEDKLRMLRAVRFKNALGFQYHPHTYNAIKKYAGDITVVSKERIFDEMTKILTGPSAASAFGNLEDLGLLAIVFPELEKCKGVAQPKEYHLEGDVWQHTLKSLNNFPSHPSFTLAWSILLHDVGKPDTFKTAERIRFDGHVTKSAEIAEKILKRLKAPTKFIRDVSWLIRHHMMLDNVLTMSKERRKHWLGNPLFADLLLLLRADSLGTIPQGLSLYKKVLAIYKKEKPRRMPKIKKLVDGDNLMQIFNLAEGRNVGRLLDALHEAQLDGKVKTKKQALIYLQKLYQQQNKKSP